MCSHSRHEEAQHYYVKNWNTRALYVIVLGRVRKRERREIKVRDLKRESEGKGGGGGEQTL